MRKPDEIMAEYLLKGGKMLAKTCQNCGSPLFEYKGETFCVVCRETELENNSKKGNNQASGKKESKSRLEDSGKYESKPAINLDVQFDQTIRALLTRIEEEQDSRRLTKLTHALKEVAESYALINQGYDNRDNS